MYQQKSRDCGFTISAVRETIYLYLNLNNSANTKKEIEIKLGDVPGGQKERYDGKKPPKTSRASVSLKGQSHQIFRHFFGKVQ